MWGSNVRFYSLNGDYATSEIDTIAGWRGNIYEIISYDINIDRYNYPGARNANYNELNSLWTYKIFQLGISYSGNAYNSHKSGTYINGTLSYDVPPEYALKVENVSVAAEMGHYSLPRAVGFSYSDYSLTLNKKINDTYTVTAQWTDTDRRSKYPPYDGNQFLGILTANF